ncbi:CAP domain-containing protein [Streptomyces sp. Pv4-95]|uniref:CAP domain-containing protein n=1 Tax=Streptomyces sp. Pv4-95 TaxID=3049543 RepID=UPI003892208D
MGRHRRSAPPTPEALRTPPVDTPAAESVAPASARHRGHRAVRAGRRAPVRTGLLGASAAMAMGAVAVASGLIPGSGQFEVGSDGDGERIRARALQDTDQQGGRSATPTDRGGDAASRGGARPKAPETDRPSSAAAPSTSPSPSRTASSPSKTRSQQPARSSDRSTSAAPKLSATPSKTSDGTSSAESQVLSLVNEERAQAGCSPVTADKELGTLAQRFSDDMAARGFFDHTDPDGDTPWDRARQMGISDLGGENIARGQADAQAVMESWMDSPGHRANILNCDYKTLGVGVHVGSGGPWWTQDFGF